MSHFTLQQTTAQIILNRHAKVRKAQEIANLAVADAVRAFAGHGEQDGTNVFGTTQAVIDALERNDRQALWPHMNCGMPIYTLRIASDKFRSVLEAKSDDNASLQVLLETFDTVPNLASLSGRSADLKAICAKDAMLDCHPLVRKKMEQANHAVMEATRASVEEGDPLSPYIYGTSRETLTTLGTVSKSRLLALLMTGLPIFQVSLDANDLMPQQAEEGDTSAIVAMLKSFSNDVPMSTF